MGTIYRQTDIQTDTLSPSLDRAPVTVKFAKGPRPEETVCTIQRLSGSKVGKGSSGLRTRRPRQLLIHS